MTSVQELRDALGALAQQQALTNDAIQRLATVTLGAVSTGPAAGPIAGLTALQIVRKSSEPTVQLSLSDSQYTVLETDAPTTGLTAISALPETDQAEINIKSEALLELHRNRGFKVKDAQRTLPDGAWVNDTPADVDRYRLPSPPLRSLTHSELNRREQSAVTALSKRQWDKRWSYSYNMDEFESIVASSYKKDILKFASFVVTSTWSYNSMYLWIYNMDITWRIASFVLTSTWSYATELLERTSKHAEVAMRQLRMGTSASHSSRLT